MQEKRIPKRSEFVASIDVNKSYGDNVALITGRLSTSKSSSSRLSSQARNSKDRHLRILGFVFLCVLVMSIGFAFNVSGLSGLSPGTRICAFDAYAVASNKVKKQYDDAVLVSIETGISSNISSLEDMDAPLDLMDGGASEWRFQFFSIKAGLVITVATSGNTIENMNTSPSGAISPSTIDVSSWRIDSWEATRIALQAIEVLWRADSQTPVSLELSKSEERNETLWFIMFAAPGIRVKTSKVVIDFETGFVLYTVQHDIGGHAAVP